MSTPLSRRDFLRLSSIAMLGLAATRTGHSRAAPLLPDAGMGSAMFLGRVVSGALQVMDRPHAKFGKRIGWVNLDQVFPILQEVAGVGWYPHNNVWYRIEAGYIYSSQVQPVENVLNQPPASLPSAGMFGDISVPFIDARASASPRAAISYRLYYSSIFLARKLETGSDGKPWYQLQSENQKTLWIPAETLRIIPPEDISPLSPQVENKRLVVDLTAQTITALENDVEVFRTRVASGREFFADDGNDQRQGLTDLGSYPIWSKRISRHMIGGTADHGYDLPGVGWVCYFTGAGAAIHSTYWHNDYGQPRSSGCLNCSPTAARWLFRWTTPVVDYQPGNVTVKWPGGTRLEIVRS
jgi:hypothetical protein